jgi:hypothetical protein
MVDFDEFITALEQEMADGKNIDFSDVRLLIAKIAKLKNRLAIIGNCPFLDCEGCRTLATAEI